MDVVNPYVMKVPKKAPATENQLRKEISSSESTIMSSYMIKRFNPDILVGKRGLKIYQEMKTDDQVKASLTVKKFARLSAGWEIKPGDETNKQSVEMADFIRYSLKMMKGTFEQDLLNIFTGIEYGFSLAEKVFGIYDEGKFKGKIGLMKLGAREPFGYDFKTDEHNNIIGVVFENIGAASAQGDLGSSENPFPPEKFVIYSYNPEHGNLYGTSDLRAAYAAYWSKRLNIKWWNIFNERFGAPTVMAKYPAKAKGLDKNAITEIDDILSKLQAKSGFRYPDNVSFELLEATRQGKVTYGDAISRFDGMIARAILVPSLLGLQKQESVGSFALGKKHFDVFLFVLEMLGKDIEETVMAEQIIKPLVKMNFGEVPLEIYPKFVFGSLLEDQTEARSKVVKILADAGLIDKREEWVREYLNVPERDLEKYPHRTPIGEVPQPPIPKPAPNPIPNNEPAKLPPKKGGKDEIPTEDMALSREPNEFEKKVNFNELNDEMDFLGEALKEELTPILIKWRDDILKKADKLLRDKDIAGVNKLQLRNVGDFKITLRDSLIKTYLDAKLHGMEELIVTGFPASIKKKFGLLSKVSFQAEPWEPIPPQEALDFFNRKVIVTIDKAGQPRKTLPLAKSAELSYYDKRAFTITGIESEYVLNQSKLLIEKGIRGGLLKETMNGIRDVFSKYIATGGIIDGKMLMPSRLETMVRTNISEAVNEGRMTMYKDPEVDNFVPFLMWSSIIDSRVSPYCKGMDGKIFKKGEVVQPPAHFNCRSTIVPVTEPEVRDRGGVNVSNWEQENAKNARGQGFARQERAVQTIIVSKDKYPSKEAATKRVKELGFKTVTSRETEGSWRFRQRSPDDFVEGSLRTKEIAPDVSILHGDLKMNMRLEPLDPLDQGIIVRCPFPGCGNDDLIELKNELGTRTFLCIQCKGQFRVSQFGNLYFYDPGTEKWIRQTVIRGGGI